MRNFIKTLMTFVLSMSSFVLIGSERTVFECTSPYGMASQRKFASKGTCQLACAGHNKCVPVKVTPDLERISDSINEVKPVESCPACVAKELDSLLLILRELRAAKDSEQQVITKEFSVSSNYTSADKLKSMPETYR